MRKKEREGLWQWDYRNRKTNFSNSIDENVGKKKKKELGKKFFPIWITAIALPKMLKKKEKKEKWITATGLPK